MLVLTKVYGKSCTASVWIVNLHCHCTALIACKVKGSMYCYRGYKVLHSHLYTLIRKTNILYPE